jgi:hypothetical protein
LIPSLKPSEELSRGFQIMSSLAQETVHKKEDLMCGRHGLKLMKLQKIYLRVTLLTYLIDHFRIC